MDGLRRRLEWNFRVANKPLEKCARIPDKVNEKDAGTCHREREGEVPNEGIEWGPMNYQSACARKGSIVCNSFDYWKIHWLEDNHASEQWN